MTDAIGILGGTFDPIHFGHLRIALDVAEQLNLSSIRFVPSARPPHRNQPQASAEQRLSLLQLALETNQQFIADDREIHREGMSYTVDTLLSLRQKFPETPLYLLMGSDAFLHIQTWHQWQKILESAHIVVMQRPEEELVMTGQLASWYQQHLAVDTDNSLFAGKIWPIAVTQLAISATDIRTQISQGQDPHYLLPDTVITRIYELGLYQNKSSIE